MLQSIIARIKKKESYEEHFDRALHTSICPVCGKDLKVSMGIDSVTSKHYTTYKCNNNLCNFQHIK